MRQTQSHETTVVIEEEEETGTGETADESSDESAEVLADEQDVRAQSNENAANMLSGTGLQRPF